MNIHLSCIAYSFGSEQHPFLGSGLHAERAREEEARQRSELVAAEEETLPTLLAEQRHKAEEEARLLESQSVKLQSAEHQKKGRLAALEQALTLYRDHLGLVFQQGRRTPTNKKGRWAFVRMVTTCRQTRMHVLVEHVGRALESSFP